MCNQLNNNMTNQTHLNEDRSSVASSEDSGISSSNGDEVIQMLNEKDNCPTNSLNGIINRPHGTHNNVEMIEDQTNPSIFTRTGNQNDLAPHTSRPNSATTDLSNSSESETSELLPNLKL